MLYPYNSLRKHQRLMAISYAPYYMFLNHWAVNRSHATALLLPSFDFLPSHDRHCMLQSCAVPHLQSHSPPGFLSIAGAAHCPENLSFLSVRLLTAPVIAPFSLIPSLKLLVAYILIGVCIHATSHRPKIYAAGIWMVVMKSHLLYSFMLCVLGT